MIRTKLPTLIKWRIFILNMNKKNNWENTFSPTIYKTWDCELSENLGLDMIPKKVNMVD